MFHRSYGSDPGDWTNHASSYIEMERLTRPLATQLIAYVDGNLSLRSRQCLALDHGCGTGILSSALKDDYTDIPLLGVDAAQGMIDTYDKRARKEGWKATTSQVIDARDLHSIPDGSITHAFSTFVICLAPDPTRIIRELFRVIAKGGILGLATWSDPYFLYWSTLWTRACQQLNPHYECPMLLDPEWTFEGNVRRSLSKAGFKDIKSHLMEELWSWDTVEAASRYFFDGRNPRVEEYHRSWEASGGTREAIRPVFTEVLAQMYCDDRGRVRATVGAVLVTARREDF